VFLTTKTSHVKRAYSKGYVLFFYFSRKETKEMKMDAHPVKHFEIDDPDCSPVLERAVNILLMRIEEMAKGVKR
jgi:hypothetical protein